MWLKAYVPEADIALIRVGQELEVKVIAMPNRVFRARVIAIGASSEAQTRRVMIRSEVRIPIGRSRRNVRQLQDIDWQRR